MEQPELFYAFGSIPFVLVCVVSAGLILFFMARKRAGRVRFALRILVYSVSMLYLLLFTVLAIVCIYKVSAFYQKVWIVPWITLLFVGEVAVFGWLVFRDGIVMWKSKKNEAGESLTSEIEPDIPEKGQETTEEWIGRRLSELFDGQRIYREFELHIEDVAIRIGTNRTYLSKVLNQKFGYNFFRFVNRYRLEEAKELLLSTSLEVHRIAKQVGYKNINTFNACFREYFGMSPKQWKRVHMELQEVNL